MKYLMMISMLVLAFPLQAGDNWIAEVNAIHAEIETLTVNRDGKSDEQRLERFYDLSYDLTMLEHPGYATSMGDPRGQGRLEDLSLEGVARRQKAERDSLALINSMDRNSLSQMSRVNYDLLLDTLQRDVRTQQFPSEYLQMTQMSGPQQDLASLLAMMPNTRAAMIAGCHKKQHHLTKTTM